MFLSILHYFDAIFQGNDPNSCILWYLFFIIKHLQTFNAILAWPEELTEFLVPRFLKLMQDSGYNKSIHYDYTYDDPWN